MVPTVLKGLSGLLLAVLLTGCATTPLNRARSEFYTGRFDQAESSLVPLPGKDKDQVLFLMERGMARQALGKYEESSADWRAAAELQDILETYSISRGTASLLTNDRILSFRGQPYEQTLLYAFLAKNYLAMQNWDYAAICARNIIQMLENRDGFPDIAYSRYMAGFALELINDPGNAALQYRTASDLIPNLFVAENTGGIHPVCEESADNSAQETASEPYEFVCFVAMGELTAYKNIFLGDIENTAVEDKAYHPLEPAPYAEFYHNNQYLGRSYMLDNTSQLRDETEAKLALLRLAKGVSRIAIKETISQSIEQHNELLGFLTRVTLFAFETPDTRQCRTLPLWLGVARLPSMEPITKYTVIFRGTSGHILHTKTVTAPISRRGNTFISFCRDIPDQERTGED